MVPAAVGYANVTSLIPFALFFATALSISALPVILKTLMDPDLYRTRVGQVTVAATIFENLVGWITFACILSMIGVHALFGAVLTGVAFGDSEHFPAKNRESLSDLVTSCFGPLFFAMLGLRVDFVSHFDPRPSPRSSFLSPASVKSSAAELRHA